MLRQSQPDKCLDILWSRQDFRLRLRKVNVTNYISGKRDLYDKLNSLTFESSKSITNQDSNDFALYTALAQLSNAFNQSSFNLKPCDLLHITKDLLNALRLSESIELIKDLIAYLNQKDSCQYLTALHCTQKLNLQVGNSIIHQCVQAYSCVLKNLLRRAEVLGILDETVKTDLRNLVINAYLFLTNNFGLFDPTLLNIFVEANTVSDNSELQCMHSMMELIFISKNSLDSIKKNKGYFKSMIKAVSIIYKRVVNSNKLIPMFILNSSLCILDLISSELLFENSDESNSLDLCLASEMIDCLALLFPQIQLIFILNTPKEVNLYFAEIILKILIMLTANSKVSELFLAKDSAKELVSEISSVLFRLFCKPIAINFCSLIIVNITDNPSNFKRLNDNEKKFSIFIKKCINDSNFEVRKCAMVLIYQLSANAKATENDIDLLEDYGEEVIELLRVERISEILMLGFVFLYKCLISSEPQIQNRYIIKMLSNTEIYESVQSFSTKLKHNLMYCTDIESKEAYDSLNYLDDIFFKASIFLSMTN